ncbi:MAG: hypothetical protein ACXACW_13685, partial [Candidatus Hodarchaeales archaeon]
LNQLSEAFQILVPLSLDFLPLLLVFIVVFLVLTLILAYMILWIMSKVAKQVTIFVSVLFPVLMMTIGVLMIGGGILMPEDQIGTSMMGMFIAGFGFLLLAFVIWKFRVIQRSGKFVEFSAQLVLDEKAVLAMPLLLGLYSIVTGFFMLFGFLEIYSLFEVTNAMGEAELSYPGLILAIIFEYFYLIVYLGVYYSLSAGVISYASDWYRGLDPDLGSAMKDVRQVFPVILKFAFAMASVKIIMQIFTGATRGQATSSRGRGNAGAAIGGLIFAALAAIIISILGAIWMFLNYFTLVSIVQNKKGLSDSIKDSAKTTWGALVDVLVGETGFGLTTFIFAIVNALLWLGVGFSLGVAATGDIIYGLVFAVIFVFLGSLPYNVVTMPMKVAFRTFIYSYAKDSIEGFKKPSKLPAELRNEFKTLSRKDVKRRGMRDPAEYF